MTETTRKPISRRTVAKGAAWTAPVILGGVAAPSLAASPPPVNPQLGGASCKHTESVKRYHVQLIFVNGLNCSTTVHITKFVVIANSGQTVTFNPPPVTNFTIDRYSQLSWVYDSDEMGNISQGNVQVIYTYTDCNGAPQSGDVTLDVSKLDPCKFPYPHNGGSTTSKTAESTTSPGKTAQPSATSPTQVATPDAPAPATPATPSSTD